MVFNFNLTDSERDGVADGERDEERSYRPDLKCNGMRSRQRCLTAGVWFCIGSNSTPWYWLASTATVNEDRGQ